MHNLIRVLFLNSFLFPTVNAEHIASTGIYINVVSVWIVFCKYRSHRIKSPYRCEVVTECVKEETVKHDVDVVKDYGELLQKQPKEKLSDSSKSVASKVVNAIVFRLEKASQVFLGNIISALNEPKNKAKAKELIRKQARVSIQEKLKEMQKQVKEAEKERNVSVRKKNMEL